MSKMWQCVFARLDRVSRERALTMPESLLLERALNRLDEGKEKPARRVRSNHPNAGGAWSADEEARFCDLIADGYSPRRAGVMIGRGEMAGSGKFDRIKSAYGWQAQ